jgi:hypothetical protein
MIVARSVECGADQSLVRERARKHTVAATIQSPRPPNSTGVAARCAAKETDAKGAPAAQTSEECVEADGAEASTRLATTLIAQKCGNPAGIWAMPGGRRVGETPNIAGRRNQKPPTPL